MSADSRLKVALADRYPPALDTRRPIRRVQLGAMVHLYGEEPIKIRTSGGSIPIAPFVRTLGCTLHSAIGNRPGEHLGQTERRHGAIWRLACVAVSILGLGAFMDHLTTPAPPPAHTIGGQSSTAFYADIAGSPSGDGSISSPWDLATALSGGGGVVQPGDTIWVRGGTYAGDFRATVAGRPGAPVIVRQFPGERAIIDGAGGGDPTFSADGDWVTFWGFELTNSDPARFTENPRDHAFRPNVVVASASHTKFVNLVVHDGGVAFFTWSHVTGVEIYGSIIYHNGWQNPNRGAGHALYLKSETGVLARDNVMFNQYGYGIHAYTNAGTGALTNVTLDGNVAFNNGSLASPSDARNLLLGGHEPATGAVIRDNMTYYSPGIEQVNAQVGFGTATLNEDVVFERNYLVGGDLVLWWFVWRRATVAGNVLSGPGALVRLEDTSLSGYSWGGNTHHHGPAERAWYSPRTADAFVDWQQRSGLGASDRAVASVPARPHVVVRPNQYEAGRAHVIVYNWTGLAEVGVDVRAVLRADDLYEVRSVQNLWGPPITSGTCARPCTTISIPLRAIPPPSPVGEPWQAPPTTGPAFDVFLLTRLAR